MSLGLAPPSVRPDNFIIAYATGAGMEALNGEGRNSPYVGHLLRTLEQRGLTVEAVLKRVRRGVIRDSRGVQQPQYASALSEDFVFRTGAN
jgi:uncharacterized caspase-like protein